MPAAAMSHLSESCKSLGTATCRRAAGQVRGCVGNGLLLEAGTSAPMLSGCRQAAVLEAPLEGHMLLMAGADLKHLACHPADKSAEFFRCSRAVVQEEASPPPAQRQGTTSGPLPILSTPP